MEKFSYSKLSTYEQCPFKFKLQYIDGHFIHQDAIATDFGTLIHFIQETMAKTIISYQPIDFDLMKSYFINGYDERELIKEYLKNDEGEFILDENGNKKYEEVEKINHIKGINDLKRYYPEQFYEKDKSDRTYEDKANYYLNTGMYRLRQFLMDNPDLDIVGIEKEFKLKYNDDITFSGAIDIVFQNVVTGELLVGDYKTYAIPLEKKDLATPLQFVIYSLACKEIYGTDNISCFYELPLCDIIRQPAGTSGYIKRGITKINKLLDLISNQDYEPKPCPLCHWCVFSKTYINEQPEEAKNLCPYYCHWTKNKKDMSREFEWMGIDNHDAILEAFIKKHSISQSTKSNKIEIRIDDKININSERRFLIRR